MSIKRFDEIFKELENRKLETIPPNCIVSNDDWEEWLNAEIKKSQLEQEE